MNVTPEALAKIPAVHRHTIALWLTQRADQIQPSCVIPGLAATVRDCMWGAAADICDPLSEDSTLEHAHEVLSRLTRYDGSDADTSEVPR